MTTFYLIRHGETDWNATGLWQGHQDVPLNELGRTQARLLAERLRTERAHFDAIYSSDLLRAWETARIVGAALDLEPQPLQALREINLGSWGGLNRQQILERDADRLARLDSGEDVRRGGDGERFADLYQRVLEACERLFAEFPNGDVALFTHGGTARALLLHAARDKVAALRRPLHIGNTAISVVKKGPSGWQLGAVNDMRHLEQDPQAQRLISNPPDDAERP